ncbi:MAG: mannonate dehydratase [Sediminibacterium sp.]
MLMHQTMRWYGPHDVVKLSDIRQAGCAGVVTALHHIPVGDIWTVEEIKKRIALVESAGMSWTVVESLPVSDDIKRQTGDYLLHIENYKVSLQNLAACGIQVVTYNFMPVLDWLRTDIAYTMKDGSKALYFNRLAFIAFDLYLLKRPGAAEEHAQEDQDAALALLQSMSEAEKDKLFRNLLLGLPGSDDAFTAEQVLAELKKYQGINTDKLREHLVYFLKEVVPVAEALGVKMAIHPDDPPYPVLGLPRIVSTESDAAFILSAVDLPANGLCFCTGSYGARADNNIVAMLKRFSDRIHFLHLRNTKRDEAGNFYEAAHLEGDTDMYEVISEVLKIQQRRNIAIPMRPDHGHQMLDDLQKTTYPGYSAIGRLKSLAELRGVEYAIHKSMQA